MKWFLAAVSVVALGGCGAGHASTQRTITLSARQADQRAQAVVNCGASTSCYNRVARSGVAEVILCGHGVSTNGSCVFADQAASAVRQAGSQPGLVVMRFADGTVNPLNCERSGGGLRCKSRRSQVWVQIGP